jgi:hypothetical protein
VDTKMASSYANIFMGRLERDLLIQAPVKPLSWLQFIDDIEMEWAESARTSTTLLNWLMVFTRPSNSQLRFLHPVTSS